VTPEEILESPPRVLSQDQRRFYFDNGYLHLENFLPGEQLERLQQATEQIIEESRKLTESDAVYDLEPDHTAAAPRLRRLTSPVDHHPAYWEYGSDSIIVDIAADLVGPNVKYHHSKLNFKWQKGGEEVKWHQDIGYWPHTNYSPLTIGTYLHDVGDEQGPMAVLPGSHDGPLFDQYNDDGTWVGCLSNADLQGVDIEKATSLKGPAGSITIHNCRIIHGSMRNESDLGRPLLLYAYSAADAFPYTANPLSSPHSGSILRGKPARWARHDPRPCLIPPDWSGGYTSIYAVQQEENWAKTK
jgi:ectoine hydroxylase